MAKRPISPAVKALRDFRGVCKTEKLGLECALATLAIQAVHMDDFMRIGTWQEANGAIGTLRKEIRNVRLALRKEGFETTPQSDARADE